ncbi:alkylation response protein AidB-like acyl-CoA dehydrogenase [Streptomyces sp. V4I23]|uniref:acyl-CoA dehydrogenase family protein n=1 Tax=Streptomyces sp. V4I23 TaxID=3042282 RepID=UPI00277D5031|nr:acyl-CoA dehydrogenase family protein [Streptomyces sp. V4I23]MDQ1008580.1 alkylation response protein AidB-like acyl-CoA dehydrogenase [Streptomyces sp. V4I23]
MTEAEAGVRRRITEVENAFGDPDDAANPVGFAALLAADERGELPAEAERRLDAVGFGAEFVPVALGGRLARADVLARVLRPVFRRDVALGFGYGITSLFAASAVWAAGSEGQRARLAELMRRGGRAGIVHHSLAHGNIMWQGELAARRDERGFVLSGRKDGVVNAERAGAFVVYARTGEGRGPASHSVLLLEPDEVARGGLRVLPRQLSTGMRGCRFAGLELQDCRLPAGALVGELGEGMRLALRTFQLNRSLVSSVVLGAADTVLRAAVRASDQEGGAGRRQRAVLASVFADLLLCDTMATAVLRSLHLVPDSGHLGAAAVKYLVPDLVREDLEELGTVIGSSGYRRDSAQGFLQKLLRDLPAAGLGHMGTAACQAVLIPQLPLLARRSWGVTQDPPDLLFADRQPLAPLAPESLAVAGGEDQLVAALLGAVRRLRDGGDTHTRHGDDATRAALVTVAEAFEAELAVLRGRFRTAPPDSRALAASAQWAALADRYILVAAAGAALGHWVRLDGTDPFLADPAWLVLALGRLAGRLGLRIPEAPPDCVERVYGEAVARCRTGRAYDLHGLAPDGHGRTRSAA